MFTDWLQVSFTAESAERVEGVMPITPDLHQPYGFVHGGVTLALLETVASKGAECHTDFESELPFGIESHVRHRKSARQGTLRGVAELDHVDGRKQVWNVAAYDDAGDVVSSGTFTTKVVTRKRLAEKGVEIPDIPIPGTVPAADAPGAQGTSGAQGIPGAQGTPGAQSAAPAS